MSIANIITKTAVEWEAENPVLEADQLGVESFMTADGQQESTKYKFGNGVDHWNDLAYGGAQNLDSVDAATSLDMGDTLLVLKADGTLNKIDAFDILKVDTVEVDDDLTIDAANAATYHGKTIVVPTLATVVITVASTTPQGFTANIENDSATAVGVAGSGLTVQEKDSNTSVSTFGVVSIYVRGAVLVLVGQTE